MDLIRLTPGGTGAPLRYGNVIKNSELVFLNGVRLKPGLDYSMDYSVGVVYISRAFRDGDSISVQYRYDAKAPVNSGSAVAGLPGMKFNLVPGGLSMQLNFGETERTADGRVLRTNIWGTKNNFSGSGMGLSGAFFAGSSMKQDVLGSMTYDASAKGGQSASTEGSSSFLVQQFNYALGGGAKLTANIQDISKSFSAFNAVKDSGYTDDQVAAFNREKGLKRQGVGLSDLNLGGLKFSAAQSSVMDGTAGIKASSYAMNNGGLTFSHSTNEVERGFTRFKDLGVADWQKMSQSQAIRNSSDVANLKTAFGLMSYTTSTVEDTEKTLAIHQSKMGFDSTKFGFEYTTQSVDKGFNRFEADRAAFGLEAGLKRQSFNLTKGIVGKDMNLTFAQSTVGDTSGGLDKHDIGLKGKTWSLESSSISADTGFNRFSSLNAAETDANIKAIGDMYKGAAVNAGAERGNFGRSAGISRDNTTFNLQPGKDKSLTISSTSLSGANDHGGLDTLDYSAKGLKFNLRKLNLGSKFTEVTSLMGFEQNILGSVAGLSRTDLGMNFDMGKKGKLDASILTAKYGQSGLDRTKLSYSGQGIEATYNQRNVGQDFGIAGQLVDPEKAMLASLVGFKETDASLKFAPLKNMKLEYTTSSAFNDSTTELKENDLLNLGLNLDKNTQFGFTQVNQVDRTSNSTILAASLERMYITRKFGTSSLSFTKEKQQYDGTNATPDYDKTSIALETKIDKNTSFRTEQTKTNFSDGNKEDVNSNTISTQLSKNVGVSVTDTSIDRSGDSNDETKRNYGFWWDFGKGVRMSYGYVRQLTGETSGFASTGFAFGNNPAAYKPGQALTAVTGADLNGTTFGYANSANTWDDQIGRTQAFSSFALATNKPFELGFFQACKLNVNTYMSSDNSRWLKEDVASSFESHVGKYGVGYQYRGQVDQQGQRAIDRTYQVKTDFTNKAPLSASFTYKQRLLPDNKEYAIRDYQVKWQVSPGFQLTNTIQTNPEGPYNPNIVLGTTPMAQRRNIWRADYSAGKNFTFGGQFDEMRDDTLFTTRRTSGINMSLFKASGSPVSLFYGIEQNDSTAGRNSYVKFGFSFDQKPSTNQVFSFSVGNQGWLQNTDKTLAGTNDWVARLNYQWRIGK
ncbi:MAG: hypothetical protein JST12_20845 [Armatimonadetes bacterium]|nr:hypothetical protein [Armatimonadota bacterium]MBS1725533.1 hypothetical protein [Armatimonadota bacterium]